LLLIKLLLIIVLIVIFIQDIKERQVFWFLFPTLGICAGVLFYKNVFPELVLPTLLANFCLVLFLILVVYLYSRYKLKVTLKDTFGLGDILFFIAITFSFSSISFIILFVFALIFSLILHLFLNNRSKFNTVPLAGYMSLFFAFTYTAHWLGLINAVYTI